MKKYIVIVIAALVSFSCQQEDVLPSGNITIKFEGIGFAERNEIILEIFSSDYLGAPLYSDLELNDKGEISINELNHGTYVCVYNTISCSTCFKEFAFQINAGNHKVINIPRSE